MLFKGISRVFDLTDERQYESIGRFWADMAELYGLEKLRGLGYEWRDNKLSYAIGLKDGDIEGGNVSILLPDDGWLSVKGQTERLKELYDEIYTGGSLKYEIESFYADGSCQISYYRETVSSAYIENADGTEERH